MGVLFAASGGAPVAFLDTLVTGILTESVEVRR